MVHRVFSGLAATIMVAWAATALAGEPVSDAKPAPDVAWLVIGIQPDDTRVEIKEPIVRDGMIRNYQFGFNAPHAVDGFVVVKVKPGTPYGIASSRQMYGMLPAGPVFQACGRAPVFQADAGKVVYITSITYRNVGGSAIPRGIRFDQTSTYSQDLEGARAFLKAHYPGLSDSVEQGGYEMVPIARRC